MSKESVAWLSVHLLGGDTPQVWAASAEVHVREQENGEVWVWALSLGGLDPWHARTWCKVRTREGAPLLVHALRVNDGNAGVRLGYAMVEGALGDGVPCSLYVRDVLVERWTAADIDDLAPGLEMY